MIIDSIKSIIKYQNRPKRTRVKLVCGFTLVEIVIVIAIMAFLTAIIYASFDTARAKSRDQKRVSDISAIQIALEQYFQKYGQYPLDINTDTNFSPAFIGSLPVPPSAGEQYNYLPLTKTSGSSICVSYQLWTTFEKSNSYLDAKKGFNSSSISQAPPLNGYYECRDSAQQGVDASSSPLIYDVMGK